MNVEPKYIEPFILKYPASGLWVVAMLLTYEKLDLWHMFNLFHSM